MLKFLDELSVASFKIKHSTLDFEDHRDFKPVSH